MYVAATEQPSTPFEPSTMNLLDLVDDENGGQKSNFVDLTNRYYFKRHYRIERLHSSFVQKTFIGG